MSTCCWLRLPLLSEAMLLLQRTTAQMELRCQGCISRTRLSWDICPPLPSTSAMFFFLFLGSFLQSMRWFHFPLRCEYPQHCLLYPPLHLQNQKEINQVEWQDSSSSSCSICTSDTATLMIHIHLTSLSKCHCLHIKMNKWNSLGETNVSFLNLRLRAVARTTVFSAVSEKASSLFHHFYSCSIAVSWKAHCWLKGSTLGGLQQPLHKWGYCRYCHAFLSTHKHSSSFKRL